MTNPRVQLGEHKVGYYAVGGIGGVNSGVKRVDVRTGRTQVFDFGIDTALVGESVFVLRNQKTGSIDDGWLIAQCPDARSERTFSGVFDASAVDAGPLAKVWLTHHVPVSFHGGWTA